MDPPPRAAQRYTPIVTGPRRSLSLKLRDTRVYEPQIRARLGTTTRFYTMVVVELMGSMAVVAGELGR